MIRKLPKRAYSFYKDYGFERFVKIMFISTPFYRLTGFLTSLFNEKTNNGSFPTKKTNSDIAVLGRGPSLSRVSEISFLECFIIINNFNKESERDHINKILKNNNIIHFMNRGEDVLWPHNVLKYNITYCQLSHMKYDGSNNWWRKKRWYRGPESVGLTARYLPEDMAPVFRKQLRDLPETGPNMGLMALAFAAHITDGDVYAAGIDFYDTGKYFIDDGELPPWYNTDEVVSKRQSEEKTKKLQHYMEKIAESFPDTVFYLYTYSDFDPEADNIYIR